MAHKKTALIWIFLLASLMMTAYQIPQIPAQAAPNPAVSVTVVATLPPFLHKLRPQICRRWSERNNGLKP